ncbi:minor capsid protein [uncultured Selenomonas sp.]|uniref:minor capsid protein n=1 Tax=uncultured Selenomonas sp. TaxID=159275 RepID=UPI0028EE9B3B|nr:minor capsid protein [uncultured Selenomonas sp.]
MEHDKYWAERFEQLTEAELRKADELSTEMVKEYRQTAQDLNDDIQRWYARFAAENKMSLAEARRVLNARELAEFRWTVNEYIKYAKKADLSEAYIQKLKNASARVHIDRLEAIRYQMAQHIEKLAAKGNARLTDVLRDIYPDAQMRTAYEVQKKKGFEPFARIPEADVDRILKKPWVSDGLNFSDRIWRDKERLLNTLQGELTRGLIRGEPYGKIAQRIAGRMGVARSAAARLVETEAAFFSSRGQLDAFRDLGVEQYEFVATLDSRTSETCREMDGKVLPLSEFKPGITAPPLHCHCRSTTCPYFDDEFTEGETRAARDPETGKTVQVDSRLRYEEWKKKYVDEPEQEPLTEDEEYAINYYISSGAYVLNDKLRRGAPLNDFEQKCVLNLDSALTKLPAYDGALQRSVSFFDAESLQTFLAEHEVDAEVSYLAYTSMTASENSHIPGGQVQLFVIQSRQGRDLRAYNEAEQEVLYPRNSRFRVKDVELIGEQFHIFLEEIDDG